MRLNELSPGSRRVKAGKRVGRGPGSGVGKTGKRGIKGQKSRSGGSVPRGFEGGQMPLQRRLPKLGFYSRKSPYNDEVKVSTIAAMDVDTIDLETLKAARLVVNRARRVKVIAGGEISRAVTIKGLPVTKGARAAIEGAGGTIEE